MARYLDSGLGKTCIQDLLLMKKALLTMLAAGMVATGCDKDNIIWTNNSGSEESGVNGSTTTEVTSDDEDQIDGTTFVRTITVTFSDAGATVEGDEKGVVSIDGNSVTVNNTKTEEKVKYILKGSTSNGFFKVYSNNKQAFVLDGVSITNPSGAAINNQGKKRCFVILNGTNYLADGATYSETDNEDQKAAFFSEGQLIFSGDGSLEVSAKGKSGITSDDYIHVMDAPTLKVTSSAGHGIRGKDAITVDGGDIQVTVSANMKKGMTSDSLVVFNGGKTVINVSGGTAYDDEEKEYKASSGVKADHTFVMNGGELTVTNSGQGGKGISGDGNGYFQGGKVSVSVTGSNYGSSSSGGGGWRPGGGPGGGGPGGGGSGSSNTNSTSAKGIKFDGNIYISAGDISATSENHEAIEAKGVINITGGTVFTRSSDDAINSGGDMVIKDGHVCAYSTGNDGLDANGNLYIEGGVVYAIGARSPEVAIDANSEQQKKLYVSGGVLFTIGGLEQGSQLSQSCYQASSWSKNTWYALTVDDTTYCFKTPSSGGTALVVSGPSKPSLKSGVTPTEGTEEFDGMAIFDATADGGSSVSLSSYSSGGGWW